MDHSAFTTACKHDGYDDVEEKKGPAGFTTKPHTHPFSVRGLVLSGEFRLTRDGQMEVYHSGGSFSMEAGCEHAESFGDQGATYLVARKHHAEAS
jgi:quercetin dioxygenase-like cupin family protein